MTDENTPEELPDFRVRSMNDEDRARALSAPASNSEPVPLERRHPSIKWSIERFHLNIDALRDLLDEVFPHVSQLDDSRLGPEALAALDTLSKEQLVKMRSALEDAFKQADGTTDADATSEADAVDGGDGNGTTDADPNDGDNRNEEDSGAQPDDARSDQPLDGKATGEGDDSQTNEDATRRVPLSVELLEEMFGTNVYAAGQFVKGVNRAMTGPSRLVILRNSLLTQAVSAFEVLIASIVARYFVMFRMRLAATKRGFRSTI